MKGCKTCGDIGQCGCAEKELRGRVARLSGHVARLSMSLRDVVRQHELAPDSMDVVISIAEDHLSRVDAPEPRATSGATAESLATALDGLLDWHRGKPITGDEATRRILAAADALAAWRNK